MYLIKRGYGRDQYVRNEFTQEPKLFPTSEEAKEYMRLSHINGMVTSEEREKRNGQRSADPATAGSKQRTSRSKKKM